MGVLSYRPSPLPHSQHRRVPFSRRKEYVLRFGTHTQTDLNVIISQTDSHIFITFIKFMVKLVTVASGSSPNSTLRSICCCSLLLRQRVQRGVQEGSRGSEGVT